MAVKEFLDAFNEKKKKDDAALAASPAPEGTAPVAAQTPSLFSTPTLEQPAEGTIDQAPAMQSPLTADSLGPVSFPGLQQQAADTRLAEAPVFFPGLQQQAMDTRLESAGEEQKRMGELSQVKTDAMVEQFRSGDAVGAQVPDAVVPRGGVRTRGTGGEQPEMAAARTGGIGESESEFGFIDTLKKVINPSEEQRAANLAAGGRTGGVQVLPAEPTVAATPEGVPAEVAPEVMATPESIADLSVNGTDVVTPEAITEAAPAAPVEAPSASAGGMITRDSTGESFIGGSPTAATPEEVAAFGTDATARREELETKIAAENPQITQAQGTAANMAANTAAQGAKSGAPVRQTTQERDSSEKSRAKTLRKEGQNSINEQMREFNREPHTAKERTAEKARLQGELKASIKEDRDFNRATSEANFAKDTAEYNRNTLTAAQQNVSDRGDAALESANAREDATIARATFERQNMATAAIQGAVSNLSLIEGVSEDIKAATMKNLTEGNFARAAAILSPTSTAAQIERMTETLAGDAFVDSILELKRMGGTVGQVSNAEGGKLTAAKQKLMTPGMGKEERRAAVENYLQVKRNSVQELHNAFVREFGPKAAAEAFGGSTGGGAGNQPRYPDDVDDGTPLESLLLPKSK